ncbi:MAG: adenylate/guanylate cyclase domain-containing protein [Gammaproteobacteria bacterium]|nr:adenylate/guanylate cyclase domain-containing protein [Gammaproteobacteria bacterium]
MFADISGSTHLYELLGDSAARAKVADAIELMSAVVERNNGQVIKTIGDEILCTFDTVSSAATAACELHEAVQEDRRLRLAPPSGRMRLRIGFHCGPTLCDNGDVFGDAVNVAARMTSLAKADQIITTRETVNRMPRILRASTRCIDTAQVKGKKELMEIYELIWQQNEVTRMSTGVVAQPQGNDNLLLTYRGDTIKVDVMHSQVILGRSSQADFTVPEPLASRHHVRIECRRGRFFLIDQSTNGTYIDFNGRETFVRREEVPLAEGGRISLGKSFRDQPHEVVSFTIERSA